VPRLEFAFAFLERMDGVICKLGFDDLVVLMPCAFTH